MAVAARVYYGVRRQAGRVSELTFNGVTEAVISASTLGRPKNPNKSGGPRGTGRRRRMAARNPER